MLQTTLVVVKPGFASIASWLEQIFWENELTVTNRRECQLCAEKVLELYPEKSNSPLVTELIRYMTSGPMIVLIIEGENAIHRVKSIKGKLHPCSGVRGVLHQMYPHIITGMINAIHCSDCEGEFEKEVALLLQT